MKNIGILFGGNSVESSVSIITAYQAKNVIKDICNTDLLFLDKDNNLFLINEKTNVKDFDTKKVIKKKFSFAQGGIQNLFSYKKYDCIINCCHGGDGENGKVSALLDFYNIAHTATSIYSSVIAMEKVKTKEVLKSKKINLVPYLYFDNFEKLKNTNFEINKFKFPLILKPNSLGSSIGVYLCNNKEELYNAAQIVFNIDNAIIVEKYIFPLVEYNIAVIKKDNKLIASEIEEPISTKDILSYEDKYLSGEKCGMKSLKRKLPAEIDTQLEKKIISTAKNIYKWLDFFGVIRLDFLFDNGEIYLNEINSIPGSMAGYLFEGKGITFTEILEILISEAENRFKQTKNITI